MALTLIDIIKSKVKDEARKLIDPDDFENALTASLKSYSKIRPLRLCRDLTGTNSHDLALPPEWHEESAIEAIEYPVGNIPESLLDRSAWRIYRTPGGPCLRLAELKLAITDHARLLFTALHDADTIPDGDTEAVTDLAASLCCRRLAQLHAQTGDPTIAADSVNYRSKSSEFTSLANKLETLYRNHLNIRDNDTTPAAMATAEPPPSRRTRLTPYGRQS